MELHVDGRPVDVEPGDHTLLTVLREQLGLTSVKDGCSPQGQCGCCTVLVDGAPRVSCVTPARRVVGRSVTTVDGLEPEIRDRLVDAFLEAGASQCGFCTPGILVRLAALGADPSPRRVEDALLAHLCRCTGWKTITEAASIGLRSVVKDSADAYGAGIHDAGERSAGRDWTAASSRATVEGRVPQEVGPSVVLGQGGFAADTFPLASAARPRAVSSSEGAGRASTDTPSVIAVPDGRGGWATGETVFAARAKVVAVPGRRSGRDLRYPVSVPDGDWALTLQTTWVEPGYLEPDVSWCVPGGSPTSPVANGGAFGAKGASVTPAAAGEMAARLGCPVRVVLSREDVVRLGPKRPPIGAGIRADGTGIVRVVRTPGVAEAVAAVAPGLTVEEVDVVGPATSVAIRGSGWVEAAILLAAVSSSAVSSSGGSSRGRAEIMGPSGARAAATVDVDAAGAPTGIAVRLFCGDALDEVVLRSYVVGAAHMAAGWVCSEAIATDEEGSPTDLTIRSFGILRARDMPSVSVEIEPSSEPAVNGSDAAFAAVAAATWIAQGKPPTWPTRRGSYR